MGKRQEWVQIPCPILGKCDQDIAEVDLAKDHAWSSASYEARGGIFNGISLTLISHLVGHSRHEEGAVSASLPQTGFNILLLTKPQGSNGTRCERLWPSLPTILHTFAELSAIIWQ